MRHEPLSAQNVITKLEIECEVGGGRKGVLGVFVKSGQARMAH